MGCGLILVTTLSIMQKEWVRQERFWLGQATSDSRFEPVTCEISFRAGTYWNVKVRVRMIIG